LKKIFFLIFCLAISIIFFHSFFLHKIIHYNLEKITEKRVEIENLNFEFKNQKLIINNIKILNNQNFDYENIFFCSEILINFNFLNLFKDTIFIDEMIFKNPKIYIEVKKSEDNISILEKKQNTYKPKVYPKKTKDRNVIFKKIKIFKPEAYLNVDKFNKYENLKLSNMSFINVGTSTDKSLHFKKVFKIIISDIYLRVPNFEMRKKLEDIYKIR
tara:strand:- start:94 stop:738 length:645 start_codon:yes stop_codon:yes gene_type:complete